MSNASAARWASLLGALASIGGSACSHDWNGLLKERGAGGGTAAGGGAEGGGGSGGGVGSGGSGGSASSSGGAGGGGGAGGDGGMGEGVCPTGAPGAALLKVPATGGAYCIDATEVTNQDYATFLATGPLTGAQPAYCIFNGSFAPSAGWPAPAGTEQVPVKSVDWCDARAFCAYAGKRLCGKIGGGANAPADWASATKSEWFNACSASGTLDYPYGDVYSPGACNGADYGAGAPVDAQSAVACTGGVAGVHDMSGNVWEWEDSCSATTGASDTCHIRGGGYINPSAQLSCAADSSGARNLTSGNIGFRCCAGVEPQ